MGVIARGFPILRDRLAHQVHGKVGTPGLIRNQAQPMQAVGMTRRDGQDAAV